MKRLRPMAASLALASALSACELIATFDRDRIDEEVPDVGVLFSGDGAVLGGDRDSAVRDAGLFDGATTAPDEDAASDDADVGELDAAQPDDADVDAAEPDDAGSPPDAGDGADGSVAGGDADVTDADTPLDAAG